MKSNNSSALSKILLFVTVILALAVSTAAALHLSALATVGLLIVPVSVELYLIAKLTASRSSR
ncbi:hypothetical protein [Streptomyces chrestomyceticus]|uniref:hypothetical protein n=1 Tax=Streptomyces chrestomyceticus TaxID=68185 RepID=UPI0034025EDF